jgi:O-antigen biosynthesis protein
MLEWTGERFLPWIKDPAIAYEHVHRYAYAARFVREKRVLDLASGEGYGSRMLAAHAALVIGIDIDEHAVRHAQAKYGCGNLQFIAAAITDVPIRENHSFDTVVCFEAIEHVDGHDDLLREVKRLLRPDGLLILSTPNKEVYHEQAEENNPYHVKELSPEELHQLLGRHFRHVQYLGQRIHPNSSIWPLSSNCSGSIEEVVVRRADREFAFIANDKRVPVYVIALASDSPAAQPEGSVLIDYSNELLNEKDRNLAETEATYEEALKWREQQLTQRDLVIADREQAIAALENQLRELSNGIRWQDEVIQGLRGTVAGNEEALAWRAHQVEEMEKEKAALQSNLQSTQRRLAVVTEQLEAIHASRGWKFILRLRAIRDRMKALVRLPGPR